MGRSKGSRSDYEVGYAKPPQHTRFQAGRSGNSKGRPKGTKNLKTDLMEELAERISISEGGKPKKLSKQRALVKSLTAKAIKGDARALGILLNLIVKVLQVAEEAKESNLIAESDIAILDNFIARQKARIGRKAKPNAAKKGRFQS